ncbi:MAG: pilus assembly protein TadG-related protein [Candidatus Palauibacterales bacterium]|nr:pilus assembly protein TadG-related protein [Candidatus Palauibacterales bacterium]
MRSSRTRRRLDERGAALVLIAVLLATLLMAAALAVDVGLLTTARTEAQRAADTAAHAGASALILDPYSESAARSEAIAFAARNRIRGEAAVVLPQDVEVMLDESKVRVTVHRTIDRGSPIGTFFAHLFGVNEVNISAMAAAVARPAGAVDCLLPVAVADLWLEADGTRADENDTWDPDEGDTFGDGATGYTTADLGRLITLKPAQGATHGNDGGDDGFPDSNRFEPGWWYLWYPTGGGGASTLRSQVLSCPQPEAAWGVGDWVTDKNGNVQSIQKAFDDLIARDPSAYWDDGCKCVKGSAFPVSPRLRAVPMFNPETYSKQGSDSNFQIADFMGVFIVPGPQGPPGQQSTYARVATLQGLVGGGGPTTGPLVKAVQIVE